MGLPACPSLIPSQNHGPRSLGQVTIFSLGLGMMWSRASGPCQQTIVEGTQWGPGLQESQAVRLVELFSGEKDSQLSKVTPAGEQWSGHSSSMWDLTGLHPLSPAAWALLRGRGICSRAVRLRLALRTGLYPGL